LVLGDAAAGNAFLCNFSLKYQLVSDVLNSQEKKLYTTLQPFSGLFSRTTWVSRYTDVDKGGGRPPPNSRVRKILLLKYRDFQARRLKLKLSSAFERYVFI